MDPVNKSLTGMVFGYRSKNYLVDSKVPPSARVSSRHAADVTVILALSLRPDTAKSGTRAITRDKTLSMAES